MKPLLGMLHLAVHFLKANGSKGSSQKRPVTEAVSYTSSQSQVHSLNAKGIKAAIKGYTSALPADEKAAI